MSGYKSFKIARVHPIILFALIAIFLVVFIRILRGLIALLAILTPVILIATAIINYRVIVGYGKWLVTTLKSNPVFGILSVAFTVVAFPLVAAYLLFKAINSRTSAPSESKQLTGEYIKYEEIEDDFLDLSDVNSKKKDIEDKYKDLID